MYKKVCAAGAALAAMIGCGALSGGAVHAMQVTRAAPPVAAAGTEPVGASYTVPNDSDATSYWTPQRRADATTADTVGGAADPSDAAAATSAAASSKTIYLNSTIGRVFPKPGLSRSTAGRLYYVYDKKNWSCSATVVTSKSKNVVATAAHCLWNVDAKHAWGSRYEFVPDDSNNGSSRPYGIWVPSKLWVPAKFKSGATQRHGLATGSGWLYDTGFMAMARSNGHQIQNVTGGAGIAFNRKFASVVVIGYPAAKPFTGKSERYCSTTHVHSASNHYATNHDHYLRCAMTPGSSGGAWFSSFNRVRGTGYVVGATSQVSVGGSQHYLFAAPYGNTAKSIYRDAIAGHSV